MPTFGKKKGFFDRETIIILVVLIGGIIATFSGIMLDLASSPQSRHQNQEKTHSGKEMLGSSSELVPAAMVPLSTGTEPIEKIFIQSGCAVCHTIPGIKEARGKEGPKLMLGSTGSKRLTDPRYSGTATTVREYIMESILSPGTFIVPGYPDRVMPRWYGKKLSAQALEKIATYLEGVTDSQ